MSRDRITSRQDSLIPYGFELGVGAIAGISAASVYYNAVYIPVSEQIKTDQAEIAQLELEASSLLFTRDHLFDKDMLPFGLSFYLTETADNMQTEAQVIRDATPNQAVEQAYIAGIGIGVGVIGALSCLLARNMVFRRRRNHRHQTTQTMWEQALETPIAAQQPAPISKVSRLSTPRGDNDTLPPVA